MRCALILLAALAMGGARAEGPSLKAIGLHVATAHFRGTGWNNTNPGVYLLWGNGLTVGALHNSERSSSAYAAWSVDHALSPRLRATLTAGFITGYRRGLSPLLAPSLALALDQHTWLRLSYLPQAHRDGGSDGLHFSIERRF